MSRQKILIVDDEPGSIEAFKVILKDEYDIVYTSNAEEGLRIINNDHIQLVLLDIIMPDMDGLTALRRIREIDSNLTVVMVTATRSIKSAVEAMKLGAFDYLSKPFDINEAKLVVRKAIQSRALLNELEYLRSELKHKYGFNDIIGKSKVIKQIFQSLQKAAETKATVLVTGESGTGKELVARALHFASPRKDKPFIAVQCAAIPETLMESELFGHEKGAFTDASSRRLGKFEVADGGTLFLDEIGEMSASLQAKMLRVLEQQEITRVGSNKTFKVDVRVVAATNRDLKKEVKEGNFREDLFYRLDVVPIHLAPLRERKEDIPLLVNHFLQEHSREINPKVKAISAEALELLAGYSWPGNVRELENVIERILTLVSHETILPEDLPIDIRRPETAAAGANTGQAIPSDLSLPQAVDRLEKQMITQALNNAGGNLNDTAQRLGITRRVLRYKIDILRIDSNFE